MRPKNETDICDLRNAVIYDPETGALRWRSRPEKEAGGITTYGYRLFHFKGKNFLTHRAAWALMKGEWPQLNLDHINGNGLDNRWSNLRLATLCQNMHNARLSKRNTSGVKGVNWHIQCKKWRVNIMVERVLYQRYCDSFDDAVVLASRLRGELHGEFANNG